MRNLRNIRHDLSRADSDISAACWDAGAGEVLVTFGPTEAEARITLARIVNQPGSATLEYTQIASWDAPSPTPDLLVDRVVNLHYFSDISTACLVLAGGDVVIVREDCSGGDGAAHIEIVGSIDAGIAAARWSYDDELLVLATKAATVIFMSRSFDPVTEVTLTAEDLKASKHVSVGWGKKETQFQGKGAKALRDPTIPEKVDQGTPSPLEDGRTTVSWREDGAYVAINSVEPGSRRVIRVYTREGALDSASEPVDGLEGSLSWRPSGNLMAGIQRLSDRVDVVFFERNGLRHGQFTLRFPSLPATDAPIHLEWNPDSTVLAARIADIVQLWTMGNYHWYLKQELRVSSPCSDLAWHPEKPLRLAVAAARDLVQTEWVFHTSRGSVIAPHDFGAVAVIDGKTLKLTPFRTVNMPPPMAMFELSVTGSIVDVAFTPDNSHMAVLHHNGVDIYEWQTKAGRSLAPIKVASASIRSGAEIEDVSLLQVAFSCPQEFYVLGSKQGSPSIYIYAVVGGDAQLLATQDASLVSSILASANSSSGSIYAQDRTGKLLEVSGEGQKSLPSRFATHLPWVEIPKQGDGEFLAVGLSRRGHLYANTHQLAKNCTSFLVTDDHLIFTTTNHLLKLVHLAGVHDLEVPADDPETDERCRSLERGARLVTAVPSNMNVVLQMPRGNLETIYPRAMVVAGIRQLIDDRNYSRAFAYCRTQRVDMNILYDHQPEQFLSHVGLFLEQLGDTSYIDLFLSSLRAEDVTQTMYKDTKRPKSSAPPAFSPAYQSGAPATPDLEAKRSKVNTICDAVLAALQVGKTSNLQNIITANVCKDPPALGDGLLVVASLMKQDEALAEKAVEHICFLVDVNRLYDTALGLYNLELALLVAQQSQRDPKEYLPFIQSLHQMPELRRQFTIDDHLGNQEKALGHLKSSGEFEATKDYTVKHSLYQAALGLHRYDEEQSRALMALYAQHLENKSKFREAGLAYEHLGNFAQATSCYRSTGTSSWRECLAAAHQQRDPAPVSKEALAELATALADALAEAKDYAAAATIHREYLDDAEAAVQYLCRGHLFAEALLLNARAGGSLDVDRGLTDAFAASTELLADCKAQLRAQVPRILELRRKAAEDPLGFYEGERPGGGGDVPDDVSVAASSRLSTSASLFTRYTGKDGSVGTAGTGVSRATSKNRKREEKKRARGRKGTVYEEEYLVNSVRRLVERVASAEADGVAALVAALFRRGMQEQARAVEALLAEVLEGCRVAAAQVWPPPVVGGGQPAGLQAPVTTAPATGAEGVMEASLEAMATRQEPPVMPDIKKLSLLG
ncbi:hypothetical protein RB595_004687 [Gaeumannomyces hyphopodioides]